MLERLRRAVRAITGRSRFDRDLRDELRDHLERRTADLIRNGLSPDEARRRAHIEFGAVEAYTEQIRDGRGGGALRRMAERFWRDLRIAGRRLSRAPLFTVFSVVTLALGIGVTTAAYSFVASAMHADPGVRDPGTLVRVTQTTSGSLAYSRFSWPDVEDLTRLQTSCGDVAAFATFSSALSDGTTSQLVAGESVSGNMFRTIGVEAALGRTILPDDDRPDAPGVVFLSDRTWRVQFGADSHIVGRPLRMAGRVFEVIGVAPAAFRGVSQWGASASVWVPIATAPATVFGAAAVLDRADRNARGLTVIARLAAGRSLGDAVSETGPLATRLDAIAPIGLRPSDRRVIAAAAAFDSSRLLRVLSNGALFIAALPALVLLVACSNLGNLVLSRGVARQHEFAVRRAIGASRGRIVVEQLVEGLIVAAMGGVGGVLTTIAILAYLRGAATDVLGALPEVQFDARVDGLVFAAAAGFALLAVLVSSLSPALQLTREQDRRALTSDGGLGMAPKWRSQSNLIALQVTASVVLFLLTALGVTVMAFGAPTTTRAGLDHVAFVSIPFSRQQGTEARVRATLDRVVARARATPGVDAVEIASIADSRQRGGATAHVTSPSRPFGSGLGQRGEWLEITASTPGVFKVLGATIRYGRPFDERDTEKTPLVAVINEGLAGALYLQTNAVGRDLLIQTDRDPRTTLTARIVGITSNVVDSAGRIQSELFLPFAQHFEPDVALLARSSTLDVRSVVTMLKTTLHQEDPDAAISFGGRADLAVGSFGLVVIGMATSAVASLALLALVLSMTGLYGVLSMVVAKRTRELGLRMALGADHAAIARLVLRDGFRPILEGLFVGLAATVVIRMLLQPMFTKTVTPFDPIAFAFAVVPLLVAGAVACYIPARRASRVEPNVALRDQ